MNLQDIFYILGIAFVLSWFILIIVIIAVLVKAYKTLHMLQMRIDKVIQSVESQKSRIVDGVRSGVIPFILQFIRSRFFTRNNRNR